jgi:Tfp pilus assembly protein PilO
MLKWLPDGSGFDGSGRFDACLLWPLWRRQLMYAVACLAVFGLLWLLFFSALRLALADAEKSQQGLRAELTAKLLRAATLPLVQAQQAQLAAGLRLLENKLPGPQDMAALCSDISRAGRARKLRFELLRPADIGPQRPYAQQRIAVRVAGRYQDLAGFAADMAELGGLLSIQSFTLRPGLDGALLLDASLRTVRLPAVSEAATSALSSAAAASQDRP